MAYEEEVVAATRWGNIGMAALSRIYNAYH